MKIYLFRARQAIIPSNLQKLQKTLTSGTKVWFVTTVTAGNYSCDFEWGKNDGNLGHTHAGSGQKYRKCTIEAVV